MAGFLSYERLLRKYLRSRKPDLILEWGTGNSTMMMLEERPEAEIHTIDHDPLWFSRWRDELKGFPNVCVYCVPLTENYYLVPLAFKQAGCFDFVFVDGRQRVNCLKVAKKVIKSDGVVILHDSERARYRDGKALFKIIEEETGTAVMLSGE